MGMYDEIEWTEKCPHCKELLDNWQSKDGPCGLYTLNFWEVNRFYDCCKSCGTWVEYVLGERPNRELKIEDYEKIIKIKDMKEHIEDKKLLKRLKYGGKKSSKK